MSYRTRYWVFTDFNVEKSHQKKWLEITQQEHTRITYVCFGIETCPESKKKHLQGYLEVGQKVSMRTCKDIIKDISTTVHIEPRMGSQAQAINYCSKEEKDHNDDDDIFFQSGLPAPGQGARTDLIEMKRDLDKKMPLIEISDKYFGNFIRYHRGIEKYISLHTPMRFWETIVICYWGKTGTGKSKRIYDELVRANKLDFKYFWVYPGKGWFDSYSGQDIVILDEFYGDMQASLLLKVLDRYPLSVPTKGSHVNFCPKVIYITSNVHPEEWYPNIPDDVRNAILRKITTIIPMNGGVDTSLNKICTKPSKKLSHLSKKNARSVGNTSATSSNKSPNGAQCAPEASKLQNFGLKLRLPTPRSVGNTDIAISLDAGIDSD